jgi:hypothetical protein
MKLIERYKLDVDNPKGNGGFVWINSLFIEILTSDVKMLTFESLYSSLIVRLYDGGYIPKSEERQIEKIKYYLDNKTVLKLTDTNKYEELRVFTNGYYGRLGYWNKNLSDLVTQYTYQMWEDILDRNKTSNKITIVYIDTDRIFFKGDLDLFDIDFKYEIENIDQIYFKRVKQYIISKDGLISKRGYHIKGPKKYDDEGVVSEMRSINRSKKIDSILS